VPESNQPDVSKILGDAVSFLDGIQYISGWVKAGVHFWNETKRRNDVIPWLVERAIRDMNLSPLQRERILTQLRSSEVQDQLHRAKTLQSVKSAVSDTNMPLGTEEAVREAVVLAMRELWSAEGSRQDSVLLDENLEIKESIQTLQGQFKEFADQFENTSPQRGIPADYTNTIVNNALISQINLLQQIHTESIKRELEHIKDLTRRGKKAKAREQLSQIQTTPTLPPEAKAECLLVQGSLELQPSDPTSIERAEHLKAEAEAIAPNVDSTRLTALIQRAKGQQEMALATLKNDSSDSGRLLQAIIHFETNQLNEALETLARPFAENLAHEADRIRSLVLLSQGELEQATLTIKKVLEVEPENTMVQFTTGVIEYFNTLTVSMRPPNVPMYPTPVPWAFVQTDETSLERLRQAQQRFLTLRNSPNTEPLDRRVFGLWYTASLGLDRLAQSEAARTCEESLKEGAVQPELILWAVLRGWSVDLKPSLSNLETHLSPTAAIAIVVTHLRTGQASEASAVLERTKTLFEDDNFHSKWVYWKVQALVELEQLEEADALIASLSPSPDLFWAEYAVKAARAGQSTASIQPEELLGLLEQAFQASDDPTFLIEACEVAAKNGLWSFAADRAKQLIARVPTVDALNLAVQVTYNAERVEDAWQLLNAHDNLLSGMPDGSILRQIRIRCQQRLGIFPAAISDLEDLVRSEPTAEHLRQLANLYLASANIRSFISTVSRMLNAHDLTIQLALGAAQEVLPHDARLAARLVRFALSRPIADELVGPAHALCTQLGFDKESDQLLPQLLELARDRKYGLFTGTEQEFLAMLNESRSQVASIQRLYDQGTVAIHLIADDQKIPLIDVYHQNLGTSVLAPNPMQQPALMIRHGGKPIGVSALQGKVRLRVDVTALLLAAQLEFLSEVESVYTLVVSQHHIVALTRMCRLEDDHDNNIRLIRDLLDRIEEGLTTGRYVHAPVNSRADSDQAIPASHFLTLGLVDLFDRRGGSDEALWIDDRWASGFEQGPVGTPIAGSIEVLQSLVSSGTWTNGRYFHVLHRMRSGNARYVPLEVDELLHHLSTVQVEGDAIIETAELTVLRQYYAACLLDNDRLQPMRIQDDGNLLVGELNFGMSLMRTSRRAMAAVFGLFDGNEATSRANWIANNLHIDFSTLSNLPWARHPSGRDEFHIAAIDLCSAVVNGYEVQESAPPNARARYFHWLDTHVLKPRFETQPQLLPAVAEQLKKNTRDLLEEYRGEENKENKLKLAGLMVATGALEAVLPDQLRDEIQRDEVYLRQTGRNQIQLAEVGPLRFKRTDYLKALQDAYATGKATVLDTSGKNIRVRRAEQEDGVFIAEILDDEKKLIWQAFEDDFPLYSYSVAERERFLRTRQYWFDLPRVLAERVIAEIATTEDLEERLLKVDECRESSAEVFYRTLKRSLRNVGKFAWTDFNWMPRDVRCLLRHLRLDLGSDGVQQQLSNAATAFVEENGLEEALLRFGGLPFSLSASIIEAVDALEPNERNTLLRRCVKSAGSPISAIHLLHLVSRSAVHDPDLVPLAMSMARRLLSPDHARYCQAFLAVLRWVFRQLAHGTGEGWVPEVRLIAAWSHSHQLFSILNGVNVVWIEANFKSAPNKLNVEWMVRDSTGQADVVHPDRMSARLLQVAGIAHAFANAVPMEESVVQLLSERVFREWDRSADPPVALFPELDFLRHPFGLQNGLNSFFGDDLSQKLRPWIGESALHLSESFLEELTDKLLNIVDAKTLTIEAIYILKQIFSDRAAPERFQAQITRVIQTVDFNAAFVKDPVYGAIGLMYSVKFAVGMQQPDLIEHLKNQLWVLVQEDAKSAPKSEIHDAFVESILSLGQRLSIEDSLQALSDLFRQLVYENPSLRTLLTPLVDRFCTEFPPHLNRFMWALRLEWRTAKEGSSDATGA
jgi:hypothetical protein